MPRLGWVLTYLVVVYVLLFACGRLVAGPVSPSNAGRFLTAKEFDAGNSPFSIASGDVNKDGNLDFVVTNTSDAKASVLFGNGDGTFKPPVSFSVGFCPVAVALANLDGGTNLDLIIVRCTGSVGIFRGNGDGTFRGAQDFPVEVGAVAVAIRDFNGDGKLDLAVAAASGAEHGDPGSISILLSDRNGSYKPAVKYHTGGFPPSATVANFEISVTAADFNRDGVMDLAVATGGIDIAHGNKTLGSLSILRGNRDGSFRPAVSVGPPGGSVTAGDLDGDGKVDLVEIDLGVGFGGGVDVLLGNGDGTFRSAVTYNKAPQPTSVLLGDFNGDGKLDLAVLNHRNIVTIFLNNGQGKFPAARGYIAGGDSGSAVAGDFNHDGSLDLVLANSFGKPGKTASILVNNGDGSFRAGYVFEAGLAPFSVAIGDLNEDGNPDLAVADALGNGVNVLLSAGEGIFLPPVAYATGTLASDVKVGDFNGDGHLDLAVTNLSSNTVTILLGSGVGTFHSLPPIPVGSQPSSVVVADFNDDGNLDLAVTNEGDNSVSVLLGNGEATFSPGTPIPVGNLPFFLIDGTFRHSRGNDRHSRGNDLAVANCGAANCDPKITSSEPSVSVLAGNGAGSFVQKALFNVGPSPNSIAVGDFNHDGFLDLAVAHYGNFFTGGNDPGGISILLGREDGTFGNPTDFAAGLNPFAVVTADFDNDGNLDLVATENFENSDTINLLVGNGDGTFQQPVGFKVAEFPGRIAVADLNNDGALDLVVPGAVGVTVLLNTGGTSVVASASNMQPRFGKRVTLSATVSSSLRHTAVPSGTVKFQDDSTFPVVTVGTAKLVAGVATFSASNLSVGTHLIRANYGGDANFNSHSSRELKLLVAAGDGGGGGGGGSGNGGGGKCSAHTAHTQSIHDQRTIRFVGTSRVERGEPSDLQAVPLDVHAKIRMELGLHKPRLSRPTRGDIASLAAAPQPIEGKELGFFGFDGLDHEDSLQADHGNQSSVEPPDQALAVSSTQVLEAVNDVVAVYSKNGTRLAGPISLNIFFKLASAKLHGPSQTYGPFVTDPRALYDADTERWFVTALMIDTDSTTGNFLPHSEILLAVSDSSDATGSFTQYAIDVTDSGLVGCPCVGDQPLLGINKDGLYITTDQFAFSDFSFKTVLVTAMDKYSLAQGTLLHAVSLKTVQQSEAPGFAIQPAITLNRHDAAANNGTEFLMNSLDFSGTTDNQLSVWALMNTASLRSGQPQLRILKSEVDTETYGTPPPVAQKDGPTPLRDTLNAAGGNEKLETLETDDDRLQQLYMAEGKLFTALTTKVTGTAGTTHSGIAWFVLNPDANACSVTAIVSQEGYVAAKNADIMFPAVAVNPKGSGVIAFSLAGPDNFPSSGHVRIDRRGVSHGIHVDSAGAGPEDGFSGYLVLGGNGTARWGDYSAAAVGPDGDLWFASADIPDQPRTPLANWGTFIGNLAKH